MTKTCQDADVVLPTLSFVEKGGSFLNIENRIQKLKPGKAIPKGIFADSYIFVRIAHKLNCQLMMDELFINKLKPGRLPLLRPKRIDNVTPRKVSHEQGLFATFSHALFDQGVRMMHNPHLSELAKTPCVRINPEDAAALSLKDNAHVHISASGKNLQAHVTFDKGVAKNTLAAKNVILHNIVDELVKNQIA